MEGVNMKGALRIQMNRITEFILHALDLLLLTLRVAVLTLARRVRIPTPVVASSGDRSLTISKAFDQSSTSRSIVHSGIV
jgi:hypothetical protein